MDYEFILQLTNDILNSQRENTRLKADIDLLTKGAANSATTIRTLNERISALEAEVNLQKYNVEFLKHQGRKTREKHRAERKASKLDKTQVNAVKELTAKLTNAAMAAEQSKAEAKTLSYEVKRLKQAIARLQEGKELPVQFVTDQYPFKVEMIASSPRVTPSRTWPFREPYEVTKRRVLQVRQTACQLHVLPEHERDVHAHAALAQRIAKEMTVRIEQEILNALRGQPTPMPDLPPQHRDWIANRFTKRT